MARASKRKQPAKKKSAAKSRSPKAAKRTARKPAKRAAAARDESSADLVYSDIRRSMHGAILRSLR